MDAIPRFEEELRALDEVFDMPDGPKKDARRQRLNAQICDKAREDVPGLRAFFENLDVREDWPAERAMLTIEALAGRADEWIDVLQGSFRRFAAVADANPRNEAARRVLFCYGFVESFPDRRVHLRLLPEFLDLSRSPHTPLRRVAVELLLGYDAAQNTEVYQALRRLLKDPDWRIRWEAEMWLNVERLLPIDHRVPLFDRIRRALFGKDPAV